MNRAAVMKGAIRAGVVAGGFTLGTVILGRAPLPGPVLGAGMLALPCLLFAVLRREDRRLARAVDDIRPGSVRPALRHLLLGKRRELHKALHR
jgi:hypothetical protein